MSDTYTRLAPNFRVQDKPSPDDWERQRLHAILRFAAAILVLCVVFVWVAWSLATRQTIETYYVDGQKLSLQEFEARAPQTNAYMISSCLKTVPDRGWSNPECDALFPGFSALAETARAQGGACELANPARTAGMFGAWSELTQAVTCDPVELAQRDLYVVRDDRLPAHLDPATAGPVTRYLAREYRRSYQVAATYKLYYLSQRDGDLIIDERFVMVRETKHGARIDWSSNRDRIDWGYVQPGGAKVKISPNSAQSVKERTLPNTHPNWTDTAIALSRAGATGCAEFSVTNTGSAQCTDDGSSWRIDFVTRKAHRL